MIYILACVPEASGGIYQYELNEDSQPVQCGFTQLPGTNWLIFSKDRRRAYATCRIDDNGGTGVASYRVDPKSGCLHELNRLSADGAASCHLCLSPDEKRLFCANYLSGSISEFSVGGNGALKKLSKLTKHYGVGFNLPRQDGPHPHFTAISPDGRYLVVNDLGLDAIFAYPLDGGDPIISRITPAGTGPRHLAFTPDGAHAYLLTELFSQIIFLDYQDGLFTIRRHYRNLAPEFSGVSIAAALRFSPDGRFLLASNRGEDTIVSWEVLPDGGLRLAGRCHSGGHCPRDFNFTPDGKWILTANEFSGEVARFAWRDGRLTRQDGIIHLPHPLMVTWFQRDAS